MEDRQGLVLSQRSLDFMCVRWSRLGMSKFPWLNNWKMFSVASDNIFMNSNHSLLATQCITARKVMMVVLDYVSNMNHIFSMGTKGCIVIVADSQVLASVSFTKERQNCKLFMFVCDMKWVVLTLILGLFSWFFTSETIVGALALLDKLMAFMSETTLGRIIFCIIWWTAFIIWWSAIKWRW